jgi:hypothetical protein
MNVLVRKMKSFGILKVQMIIGAIVMIVALIALPVSIIAVDFSLLLNPYLLGVVLIGMLMFGAFAYFLFIRPYLTYQKSPDVLAETDGEYIYLHGRKEAKIPIADFDGAMITYTLPFLYSSEFLAMLIIHLSSEKYGDVDLDVPGHGSYKLHFVSNAKET